MSAVDPEAGTSAVTATETARLGVSRFAASTESAGRSRAQVGVPAVTAMATAAVVAAACTPVVWPLLPVAASGVGAAVLSKAVDQIGGVGGGLLAEFMVRAWDRLRSSDRPEVAQDDWQEVVAAELQTGMMTDSPAGAGLRREVVGILRRVDAVQVTLTASMQESAGQLREALVHDLRALGEQFSEFEVMQGEVDRQLSGVAETLAVAQAEHRQQADLQQQTLVELTLLRQETRAAGRLDESPGTAQAPGRNPDQDRAVALDAAGVPISPFCPYPGLAAFQPSDFQRFFGRTRMTATLVARAGEQVTRPGVLMVLGASGSGKSSLLRAGLVSAIAGGALPARGSQGWPRELLTPGRRPLLELALRLASLAGIPAGMLEADLRADPTRVVAAIRQALTAHASRHARATDPSLPRHSIDLTDRDQDELPTSTPGTTAPSDKQPEVTADAGHQMPEPRLVLIVDQFEEIFTQCVDEGERQAFVTALLVAAGARRSGDKSACSGPGMVDVREAPAVVVVGVRSDFYGHCTTYLDLVPYLQDRPIVVGPMDEAGLREAIEAPAAGRVWSWTPDWSRSSWRISGTTLQLVLEPAPRAVPPPEPDRSCLRERTDICPADCRY